MDLVREAEGELLSLGSPISRKPNVNNERPASKVAAALTRKDSEKLTWGGNGWKLVELFQEVGKTTSLLIRRQGVSPISMATALFISCATLSKYRCALEHRIRSVLKGIESLFVELFKETASE
jgi:hypothetical protein